MRNHIVLALGRSGSNYLANLLNQHPRVTNYGEVLSKWSIPYKLYQKMSLGNLNLSEYLDFIYSNPAFFYSAHAYSAISHLKRGKPVNFKRWNAMHSIGTKDFSYSFIKQGITSYLKDHHEILVINLYRKNILKQFISLQKMKADKIVKVISPQTSSKNNRNSKIYLDISLTLKTLEKFDRQQREHLDMVSELPKRQVINIQYEDFFASSSSEEEYKKEIFRFLGVESFELQSEHRKILPDKIVDIVENHTELNQALEGTRFHLYLDS
ncbi:MAG: hypothetical protein F6K42_04505 [Leptolyngbya sp. SIO1D8]|nr:hypothetical protein [Leptolyngbya sp. SIO1D8]